jgi:hypothetical protein
MHKFTKNLEAKFQASSSDITKVTNDIPIDRVLDLEKEDPEFLEDFNRVINNDVLKHADDDDDQEVGEPNPYLNMKLGLPRGQDNELQHAQGKSSQVK